MQDEGNLQWTQVNSCLSEEGSEAASVKTRVMWFRGRSVIYGVACKDA